MMIIQDGDNILTIWDAPDETEAFEYISDIWDWCKIWDVKKETNHVNQNNSGHTTQQI